MENENRGVNIILDGKLTNIRFESMQMNFRSISDVQMPYLEVTFSRLVLEPNQQRDYHYNITIEGDELFFVYCSAYTHRLLYQKLFQDNGWDVSLVPENIDYQLFSTNRIPDKLTPRQFRLVLFQRGITEEMIDNVINQMEEPHKSLGMIEWKHATEIKREHPMIIQLAGIFNITNDDLDEMFIEGYRMK